VARAVASDSRSQARNRELALERLRSRLEAALRVAPPRRATKPSRSAKEARLDAKRRHSARKQDRRRPTTDD
jgi:ribosome-associated protein